MRRHLCGAGCGVLVTASQAITWGLVSHPPVKAGAERPKMARKGCVGHV
jgi:hypothetical protein